MGWRARSPASAARRRWCSKTPGLLYPPRNSMSGMGPPAGAIETLPGEGVIRGDQGIGSALGSTMPAQSAPPPPCAADRAAGTERHPPAPPRQRPWRPRGGERAARLPAAPAPGAALRAGGRRAGDPQAGGCAARTAHRLRRRRASCRRLRQPPSASAASVQKSPQPSSGICHASQVLQGACQAGPPARTSAVTPGRASVRPSSSISSDSSASG